MEREITYSIVIPAFNCKETIAQLCSEIEDVFQSVSDSYEIIIVNDGGNVDAWVEIEKLHEFRKGRITAIRLTRNYGQHNATLCGIENSTGKYIITIDDDLQVRPMEILKLIEGLNSSLHQLIYGVYQKKQHSLLKNIGSSSLKKVSTLLLKSPGKGSSFRLITKALAEKILQHGQSFVYVDELLLWYTDNIIFVKVEHEKRKTSKSGYSSFKLFKIVFNITTHYTAIPLKLMTYAGLIFSVITFLLGIFFIIKKTWANVPLGYTSLIVTILFSTSLILLSLGIIGQYLYKLYQAQNRKPSYTVMKKLHK